MMGPSKTVTLTWHIWQPKSPKFIGLIKTISHPPNRIYDNGNITTLVLEITPIVFLLLLEQKILPSWSDTLCWATKEVILTKTFPSQILPYRTLGPLKSFMWTIYLWHLILQLPFSLRDMTTKPKRWSFYKDTSDHQNHQSNLLRILLSNYG